MTRFPLILGFLGLIGISAIVAQPAHASLYVSDSNATTIYLAERNTNQPSRYNTQVNGKPWSGEITITRREGTPGKYYYYGTFKDEPIASNDKRNCTGKITLAQSYVGRSNVLGLSATWQVTGGNQCPTVGKSYTLSLTESLPRPNAKGDYQDSWSRWRVVSSDGQLNCREKPNGKIVRVLKSNKDEMVLDGRLGNTISSYNGDAWMYVPYIGETPYSSDRYQPCYVRANSRFIEPVSVPW